MPSSDLEALKKRVQFAQRGRLQKVLRSPLRFPYAKLQAHWAARQSKSIPITAATFWGGSMNLVLPEQVSCSIQRYGFFEEGLSAIFVHTLKPGMTFFDVGAHFGYFTLLASHLVGSTGRVHSFDPTPSTYEVLSSNAAKASNITTNRVACYSQETSLTLTDYGLELAGFNTVAEGKLDSDRQSRVEPKRYTVSAITLDSYVKRTGAQPDFIKIDAEGAELDILRGSEQLLAGKRPMFSLEVGDIGGTAPGESGGAVRYLLDRGYHAMEFRDGQIVRHEFKSRYEYNNLLMVPDAV